MSLREFQNDRFRLTLDIRDETLLAHPKKEYLLHRTLNEWANTVERLDEASKRFVHGSPRKRIETDWEKTQARYDDSQLVIDGQQVMQAWERPLMKAMAETVAENGGDILEVGFGMGISATLIQEIGVASHTIVEANEEVEEHFATWKRRWPERDIRLVRGRWQDVIGELGTFDGIFFDAYPTTEDELDQWIEDVAFGGGSFFEAAAKRLRPNGIFTYFTAEIDSLSRGHQDRLLEHFKTVTISVVRGLEPPEDCNYWWADSMVVVKAVK